MIGDEQTPYPGETRRQMYLRRFGELDNEYQQGWRSGQMEIIQYVQPYRGRFNEGEQNRGDRKDKSIVNDTATDSWKKLESALYTGVPNPTREWLRLTTADPLQAENDGVREYLHTVQDIVFKLLLRTFYGAIRQLIGDLIGPATGVIYMEPDDKDVVRFTHIPCGEYRLGTNARGQVDQLFHEYAMTTGQMVREFGLENCSVKLQLEWEQKRYGLWHTVLHVIEPREMSGTGYRRDAKSKPWASCWMEKDTPAETDDKFLRESGHDLKPFAAGRWAVLGEDAYGTDSPSWQAIGDIRALQSLETSSAKTIARIGDPPMNVPPNLANASLLPGARNPIPGGSQGNKFEPSVVIPPDAVTVTAAEKARFEARIRRAYLADFLNIISQDERAQPSTAEEIRAKKEERLLLLGGVVDRLSAEVLDAVVNFVLYHGQLRGAIPRPPQGLGPIKVEYLNIFAAAQKALGITSVERLANTALGLFKGTGDPAVLDKLDIDEVLDTMGDMLSTKPNLLRSDDQVAQMRAQRAKAQQAKAQGEAMVQGAKAVKDASQVDPGGLDELLQRLGPAAAAAAGTTGA